jgi:hypothetical protein
LIVIDAAPISINHQKMLLLSHVLTEQFAGGQLQHLSSKIDNHLAPKKLASYQLFVDLTVSVASAAHKVVRSYIALNDVVLLRRPVVMHAR